MYSTISFKICFQQATADTSNLILHNSCLNYYNDSMQSSIERADPYFTEKALSSIHHEIKTEVISLVCCDSFKFILMKMGDGVRFGFLFEN